MPTKTDRKRFEDLRLRYLTIDAAKQAFEVSLAGRYGSTYQRSWLSKGDQNAIETYNRQLSKIGNKIVDLLDKISPRNWRSGVPAHWIYMNLSWDDAIRPINETLSVVPPLSYGSTEHMR